MRALGMNMIRMRLLLLAVQSRPTPRALINTRCSIEELRAELSAAESLRTAHANKGTPQITPSSLYYNP